MSILLDALSQSGRQRAKIHPNNNSLPNNKSPYIAQEDSRQYHPNAHKPMSAQQTPMIIQSDSQTHWFLLVLVVIVLFVFAAVFFWTQLREQQLQTTLFMQKNYNQQQASDDNGLASFGQSRSVIAQQIAAINAKKLLPTNTNEPPTKSAKTVEAKKPIDITKKSDVKRDYEIQAQEKIVPVAMDKNIVYELTQLPNTLQKEFPILEYNAHLYSKSVPKARMIIANNKQYGELEQINNNMLVEKITSDGVVYNFKGYKVFVDVPKQINMSQAN